MALSVRHYIFYWIIFSLQLNIKRRFLNITYRINPNLTTPYFLRVLEYHINVVLFAVYHQNRNRENVSTFAMVFQFRTIIFDESKSLLSQKAREWITRIGDLTIVSTFSNNGNEIIPASCWLVPLILSVFVDWTKYIESSGRIIF